MNRQALRADALLLVAALLWGAAFVPQRTAMRHMGPLTYNGLRFALAVVAFAPVCAIRRRVDLPHPAGVVERRWPDVLSGGFAGLVLFAAASLQQAGMVETTAGKAGFITGLYVPLVPVLGLVVGERTRLRTWAGIGLAAVGLYCLSVPESLQVNRGDVFLLGCALLWAVHVLVIGKISPRMHPLRLGLMQYAVVAVASLTAAACVEPVARADLRGGLGAILYGGLASVTIAYTLQIVAQRQAPPAHAALLLSLEAVFAALAGWSILGETLNRRELLGAGLMLGGTVVSQLGRFRPRRRPARHQHVAEPPTAATARAVRP